jgi:DNA polymerase-3 subunit epsilon
MSAASKWSEFPCLAFDTETTGVSPTNDRIVTAALVELHPGQRPKSTIYVVDPGIDIPDEAANVHGYTRDRAIAEQTHTPDQMLFEVTGRIAHAMGRGIPVVAFNAAFDLTTLEAENTRHQVAGLIDRLGTGKVQPVIDPMVLANKAEPYRKKICACGCGATDKTLVGWCLHYGVRHTGAHDAGGDALAAGRLWSRILERHAKTHFRGFMLPGLHQAQVGWRKEQADSLRSYFDKNGIDHDGVDPGWPLYTSSRAAQAGVA